MRGRTSAGLDGATVVDAAATARLIAAEKPVLLDVAAADVKPADMPAERWRPIHWSRARLGLDAGCRPTCWSRRPRRGLPPAWPS